MTPPSGRPATLTGRPIHMVTQIRRHNCDQGCAVRDDCPLIARILRGDHAARPIPELIDDGVRIHCLNRRAPIPPPPEQLVGADEPALFELAEN